MSNHLGNVMVVVSDRKVYDGNVFKADLVSSTDYYAFGMVMSDRSWNTEGYRFGFNGKENDNEVKGTGNQQDYGMRIYDPRLGRFLSVNPLTQEYPFYTPYQFAGNRPIFAIDLDGAEDKPAIAEIYMNDAYLRYVKKNDNQVRADIESKKRVIMGMIIKTGSQNTSYSVTLSPGLINEVVFYVWGGNEEGIRGGYAELHRYERKIYEPVETIGILEPKAVEPSNNLPKIPEVPKILIDKPSTTEDDTPSTGKTTNPKPKPQPKHDPTPTSNPPMPGGSLLGATGLGQPLNNYNQNNQNVANWLVANPNFSIVVNTGSGTPNGVNPNSVIPGSGGMTYQQRTNNLILRWQRDISNAGGGRINPNRIRVNIIDNSFNINVAPTKIK